jgi:hypothetical protein
MSEEQQVSTGMTVTLFTLQSIYAQNEDETMEFLLESNRMNLRVICLIFGGLGRLALLVITYILSDEFCRRPNMYPLQKYQGWSEHLSSLSMQNCLYEFD